MDPTQVVLPNAVILSLDDIRNQDVDTLLNQHSLVSDELRWSLKAILMRHLLNQYNEGQIIYCDCDMYFVKKPIYLLRCMSVGGIVLTPHWRQLDPTVSLEKFRLNFRDGLFNAGCVGVNRKGISALNWWVAACLSGCKIDREQGLYVDQKYLDLLIIYFPETIICYHKGYNIADWNAHLWPLLVTKGRSLIVLIHFSMRTVARIERGDDLFLENYLLQYKNKLAAKRQTLEKGFLL